MWPLEGPPPDAGPFPGTVMGGFLEDAQSPVLGGCPVPGDDLGGSEPAVEERVGVIEVENVQVVGDFESTQGSSRSR